MVVNKYPYGEYLANVVPSNLGKCPEARRYEPYDWCELSDNICIRNTGNGDFDVDCDWYNEFLEELTR